MFVFASAGRTTLFFFFFSQTPPLLLLFNSKFCVFVLYTPLQILLLFYYSVIILCALYRNLSLAYSTLIINTPTIKKQEFICWPSRLSPTHPSS